MKLKQFKNVIFRFSGIHFLYVSKKQDWKGYEGLDRLVAKSPKFGWEHHQSASFLFLGIFYLSWVCL